jgi:hypothetical protein
MHERKHKSTRGRERESGNTSLIENTEINKPSTYIWGGWILGLLSVKLSAMATWDGAMGNDNDEVTTR